MCGIQAAVRDLIQGDNSSYKKKLETFLLSIEKSILMITFVIRLLFKWNTRLK